MSFRYMNPGLAELLDVSGGTNVTGKQYNPYGGTAFWQSSDSPAVILPEMPQEIYIHATLYLDTSKGNYPKCSFLPTDARTGVVLEYGGSYRGWECDLWFDNVQNKSVYGENSPLKTGKLHEILIYMKAGTSTGLTVVSVNGKEVARASGRVMLTNEVRIICTEACFLLSNLIISDKPIDFREHVIQLPVKATETDMMANEDGSYTADKEGQYLLQSVDTETLLKQYGSNTKITGLEFCGNPVSCTGSELVNIVGIQKAKDGSTTEWGETKLPMTPASVHIAESVEMTLDDLGNCSIGIKAGV